MVGEQISNEGEKFDNWQVYKELKKQSPPHPTEVIEFIKEVERDRLDFAAYLSVLVLCGARADEPLHYKYDWIKNPKVKTTGQKLYGILDSEKRKKLLAAGMFKTIEKKGMRKVDIEFNERKDKFWLRMTLRNQKRKDVANTVFRIINLPIDENYYLAPLMKILDRYLDSINFDNLEYNTEIFNFGSQAVRQYLVRKGYQLSLHIFRVWRSHWLTDERFENLNAFQLRNFIGWTDLQQAIIYANPSEEELLNQIERSVARE